jgi:hypothetical protein
MNYLSILDMRESLPPNFNAAARVWAHQQDIEASTARLREALQSILNACSNGGEPEIDWIYEACKEALAK